MAQTKKTRWSREDEVRIPTRGNFGGPLISINAVYQDGSTIMFSHGSKVVQSILKKSEKHEERSKSTPETLYSSGGPGDVEATETPELSPEQRRARELLWWDDLPLFGIRYTRQHLYRLIANDRFPKPVRVGLNRVAFRSDDIKQWIASLETAA